MSIWLPTVEGPRDLPDLRSWLLDHWRPGTLIADVFPDAYWVRNTLQQAALWWVESETCQVLGESAPTIPADTVLSPADMPTPVGFAVFADDFFGMEADAEMDAFDGVVRVSAIAWSIIDVGTSGHDTFRCASVGMFSRSVMHRDVSQRERIRQMPTLGALLGRFPEPDEYPQTGDLFTYLGRTDWRFGVGPDDPLPGDVDPQACASKAEDRRLLAALWALSRTKITRIEDEPIPRQVRRRAERKGLDSSVRVLRLGGQRTERATSAETSGREYQHSWIVRSHFRWQAHGPGRSERKLILVPAHLAGPADKPLLGADRVWRVVPPSR